MSSPSPSDPLRLDLAARLPATWALVIVLAVTHVASALLVMGRVPLVDGLLFGRSLPMRVAVGGQYRTLVDDGEVWRLATSVLLHADALHLTMNAVALLALGRILEPWIGSIRWLSWFALGGVGGSVVSQLAGVRQSDGASGGAFALLGVAVVLGWRWRHRLVPEDRRLLGPILWGFLALNVVLSFVLPFIDAAGHLGGLAVGLAVAWVPASSWILRVEALLLGGFIGACTYGWLLG